MELEKPQFKPSAKEKKLIKIAKEAIDQHGKSYNELETEREKYDNQIKILKEEVEELRTYCRDVKKHITRARARENVARSRLHEVAAKRRVEAQERAKLCEKKKKPETSSIRFRR